MKVGTLVSILQNKKGNRRVLYTIIYQQIDNLDKTEKFLDTQPANMSQRNKKLE